VATTLIIEPQAFTSYRTEPSCNWIIAIFDPFIWKAAIVFCIIKRFEREPISLMLLKIFIIDALKVKKFKLLALAKDPQLKVKQKVFFVCLSLPTEVAYPELV